MFQPILLTLLLAPPLSEGDLQRPKNAPAERSEPLVLPGDSSREMALQTSLERGLGWLAQNQALRADGSIPTGPGRRSQKAEHYAPVAVTALGALAYMSAGNADGRGPYGESVARAIDYLLSLSDQSPNSDRNGFIGRSGAPEAVLMHSHGLATLALAQAFASSPNTPRGARLRKALEASVHLIERTQGVEGGWSYPPKRVHHHEGSVTICLVQALRAARNAGVLVDSKVIERAVDYVGRLQIENGSFVYQLGDGADRASVALTAAAVSTLYAAGQYAGPQIQSALDAIWRDLNKREESPEFAARFPFYERLYLVQAFYQSVDRNHFERWSARAYPRLLADQDSTGAWTDDRYGSAYATAINCLVLSMEQELLPIFQR